jgi:flavin-binding protein dodecin
MRNKEERIKEEQPRELRASSNRLRCCSKLVARSLFCGTLSPGFLPDVGAILTALWPNRRTIPSGNKESEMTQKIIEVIGTSKDSFAKAAEQAVEEAAKTVRGIKWAHVDSLDMQLDGAKVLQYRATTKIYFDVQH